MTTTHQRLLLALSCVLVGCAVGATMPRLAAQSYPASLPEESAAPQWQQFCEETGSSVDRYNARLEMRGIAGWELVGRAEGVACFKRPANR